MKDETSHLIQSKEYLPEQGSNQTMGESHSLSSEHKHMTGLFQAMLLILPQPLPDQKKIIKSPHY